MGRKIPGRKHRGIRDPEKQRQVRLDVIKHKINAPPTNKDNQDIPKSLARIMDLKEKVKSGEIPEKRKNRRRTKTPATSHPNGVIQHPKKPGKPEKPTPIFTQDKGETDKRFMYRVNKVCESVMKESAFENKYGVDIKRNAVTGDVEEVVKRKKDELDEYMKSAKKAEKEKGKKKKKKKKVVDEAQVEPKLNKSQTKQLKLKTKLENRAIEKDDFNSYKDEIKFGEIVHGPPTLVAPRRVKPLTSAPRPGQKDLLLKSVIEQNSGKKVIKTPPKALQMDSSAKKNKNINKIINKGIDKTGKRKDLPNALRRQLDKQQSEVIQAYKDFKKKKYGNTNK